MQDELNADERKILRDAISQFEEMLATEEWRTEHMSMTHEFLTWLEDQIYLECPSFRLQVRLYKLFNLAIRSNSTFPEWSIEDARAVERLKQFAKDIETEPDE